MIDWKHHLDGQWATLRFGDLKVITKDNQHQHEVQLYLNDLAPSEIRVELYADGVAGGAPVQGEMKCIHPLTGTPGGYVYSAAVDASRPQTDYTPRVVPRHDGVKVPLEDARILWQR